MPIHKSIIYNGPKMEQTTNLIKDMPTNAECPCNGILFGNEKEWSNDTCYNMNFENILSQRSQSQKITYGIYTKSI